MAGRACELGPARGDASPVTVWEVGGRAVETELDPTWIPSSVRSPSPSSSEPDRSDRSLLVEGGRTVAENEGEPVLEGLITMGEQAAS